MPIALTQSVALTQTSRPTRHRFRASVPLVLDKAMQLEKSLAKVPTSDMQLFMTTFIAGFVAFYTFLA